MSSEVRSPAGQEAKDSDDKESPIPRPERDPPLQACPRLSILPLPLALAHPVPGSSVTLPASSSSHPQPYNGRPTHPSATQAATSHPYRDALQRDPPGSRTSQLLVPAQPTQPAPGASGSQPRWSAQPAATAAGPAAECVTDTHKDQYSDNTNLRILKPARGPPLPNPSELCSLPLLPLPANPVDGNPVDGNPVGRTGGSSFRPQPQNIRPTRPSTTQAGSAHPYRDAQQQAPTGGGSGQRSVPFQQGSTAAGLSVTAQAAGTFPKASAGQTPVLPLTTSRLPQSNAPNVSAPTAAGVSSQVLCPAGAGSSHPVGGVSSTAAAAAAHLAATAAAVPLAAAATAMPVAAALAAHPHIDMTMIASSDDDAAEDKEEESDDCMIID
ncbi:MAG: hypothetical protein WDW38_007088 [Sanguina aurantia]